MRAVDHAVEFQYDGAIPEFPIKRLSLEALRDLFTLLPACYRTPDDPDIRQKLLIAAYASVFSLASMMGLGLSHAIGHAIGATYGIPHGITSCISLAPTLRFKAERNSAEAKQIARILPYIGSQNSGNATADAQTVANAVESLVTGLGLKSSLADVGIS
jgi:alcohol dehydrogenase class IV